MRYATRLLRLRVHQAELKMSIIAPLSNATFTAAPPDASKRHRSVSSSLQHTVNEGDQTSCPPLPPNPSGSSQEVIPIRVIINNDSGYGMDISIYRETVDPNSGQAIFESLNFLLSSTNSQALNDLPESSRLASIRGPCHGQSLHTPYFTRDILQHRRFQAQLNDTTFVYDYPNLFRQAVLSRTALGKPETSVHDLIKRCSFFTRERNVDVSVSSASNIAYSSECFVDSLDDKFVCTELILHDQAESGLIEINRKPGENDIGMVAWIMTYTCAGSSIGVRQIIVIANDITFKVGSFGKQEDQLFYRASRLARRLGIARVFISANSGARIGVSEAVKDRFHIAWTDPDQPSKGFEYLYLTQADLDSLGTDIVQVEKLDINGEIRYRICTIFGEQDGIGVENLKGSALIAGETACAYEEIPTYSMISCRAVGIGAYLIRLAQRTVQVKNSHIILTGYNALNKVLGREVYTSNNQLGGVNVMHNNGISHSVAKNDFDGVRTLTRWISFTPHVKNAICSLVVGSDPPDRTVEFSPIAGLAYDPRDMIDGCIKGGSRVTGIFDTRSFDEIMTAWARSVICGRGRLGGIAVGIIATEARSVSVEYPADPADLESNARTVQQAGQVWFPDSSYKTAQAINDFNREGLPLFIIANWRGFSGGMKDMFDQIIKFGAMIVDALRRYEHEVFVYLPPHAELRGGAWAVIDPSINPDDRIEMFADPQSRGGVLEPEGTVQIRYRTRDLYRTMNRLDPICMSLCADPNKSDQLLVRQRQIESYYQPSAILFADLHDRPNRMMRQGVIGCILPLDQSRSFFYWRLKRRIKCEQLIKELAKITENRNTATHLLFTWLEELFVKFPLNTIDKDRSLSDLMNCDTYAEQRIADQTICSMLEDLKIVAEIAKRIDETRSNCNKERIQRLLDGSDEEIRKLIFDSLKNSLDCKRANE